MVPCFIWTSKYYCPLFIWSCWSHLHVLLPVSLLVLASVLTQVTGWIQMTLPRATRAHLTQVHSARSTSQTPKLRLHKSSSTFPWFVPCSPFLTSWVTLDNSIGRNHDFHVIPQVLALCWWSQLYHNCGARMYCPLKMDKVMLFQQELHN